jgi:hypothetical protein
MQQILSFAITCMMMYMHIVDDEQMSERAGDNHDAIIIAEELIVCPRALISNKAATAVDWGGSS